MMEAKTKSAGIALALAIAMVLLGNAACSRQGGAASFDGIFDKLSGARDFNEAKRYYTDGTIAALNAAAGGRGMPGGETLRVLPVFNEKTKWEELSKSVDGSRGVIRIRYTAHPVENMIGYEMDFQVRKTGGTWKIDLEDEVRKALDGRKSGSAAEYIRRVTRGY